MAADVGIRLAVEGGAVVTSTIEGVRTKLAGLNTSSREASAGADMLRSSLAGIVTVGTALAAVRMSDSVTTLQTQLKLSTNTAQDATKAYGELFEMAQRARVSFTELGGTYATIARSGRELGVSQERLLVVTEAIGNAMTIGGGSADSMKAALVQLGQGLASGTLRGEELNSIMEQTPRLAKALADGLGVPIGQLRKLGEQGKLTSEQVISALEKSAPQLASEISSATVTVGQAFTMLSNSAVKFIGEADKATGSSSALATGLQGIAGGIDTIGSVIKTHQTAIVTTFGVLAGAGLVASIPAVVAGIGLVKAAIVGLGVALAANPVTLTLLGLGAVAGGITAYVSGQAKTIESITEEIKELERLNAKDEPYAKEFEGNASKIAKRMESIAKLRAELRKLKVDTIEAVEGTSAEDARLRRQNSAADPTVGAAAKAAAAKAAAAGVKAAASEAAKGLALFNDVIDKSSGYTASWAEDVNLLGAAYRAKLIPNYEAYSEAVQKLLAKQPLMVDAAKAEKEAKEKEAKALKETAEARQKVIDGLTDSADSIGDQVQKLQDESTALGIAKAQNLSLAQAIELVAIARLEEKQAWAQSGNDMEAVAIIQREIDLRRQLIQEIGGKEARDAAAKGAQSAVDEWAKAGEKISDTITDALMRGFESGKGLIANLRDTFANVMQTSLVRPGVQGMVNMGSNFLGLGGGSSSTGMLSGLMNLGSTFGSSMASGFQLAMNGGTGMAMEGGWAMLTSATGGSSALAGLGQLAGAAAPWVAGAMLLSEAISGLNGGKEYTTGGGITGKFDSTGFAGRNYQTWQNDGDKVFGISVGHSSSGTNYSAMDTAQVKAFTQSFEAIKTSAAGYASAIGANATSIDAYSKEIKVAMGSDAEANAAAIAAIFTTIANEVAATVVEAKYIRDGETASATLQRLSTSLTVVNASFDLVGKGLLTVSQVGANTASQLVDRFGGADAYASAMTQFNQDFYTEEERLAKTRATLTKSFADMGMALPTTIEQYRNLVLAQDVSTEAGQKTYTTLIGLSTAFKTITDTVDPLSDAFVDIASTVKALISDIQSQRDQVASARATVSGPTGVMSASAISAAIGAAMVDAPSTAALQAANAALATANGNVTAAQTTVANRTAQLGASESAVTAARAAIPATVAYYQGLSTQYGAENRKYGVIPATTYEQAMAMVNQGYADRWTSVPNSSAYQYNASTNRFTGQGARAFGENWISNSDGWAAAAKGLNIGNSSQMYAAAAAATAGLKAKLDGANAALLKTEQDLASALAKVSTDSAALATANQAAVAAQAAQQMALAKAKAAQADYAAALSDFNVDAAQSVATLGKLREETVKYYEAQKAIADQMVASSTNLKAAVANLRSEQLDPATALQQKLAAFDSAYTMALSTTGSTQAGYADKLTALLPDLSTALQGSVGSREEWIAATAALAAKSDSIAKLLDTGVAGMDYQAESLALLDQIDTTLAALGDSTQLITDAIKSSGGLTVAGLREVVTALGGTPAFASGGYHSGGLRMVGENGPELEVTGPSYIFNAQQTAAMRRGGGSGGDTSRLEALLEMVVEELANSRAEGRATASHTSKVARILERVSRNGDSLQTVAAT